MFYFFAIYNFIFNVLATFLSFLNTLDVPLFINWCCHSLQTVLSGDVYTNLSFLVDMMDVSLELMDRPKPTEPNQSLARWAFAILFYHLKII